VASALLGRFRDAEAALQRAARLNPHDPRIYSDLGALYLDHAQTFEGPARLEALDWVERALEIAPHLPEAKANLSFARAATFLSGPEAAWPPLPTASSGARASAGGAPAPWPAALARFEACPLPCAEAADVLTRFPREMRKFGEERLLPRWARAVVRGEDATAAQLIELLTRIGQAAVACCADSMLSEVTADLRRANPAQLPLLARSLSQAMAGLTTCQGNEGASGEAFLNAAARTLPRTFPSLAAWAEYARGLCAYQSGHFPQAVSVLTALDRRLRGHYPALRLRLLWLRGASLGRSGLHAECLRDYQDAQQLAQRAGALAERAGIALNLYEKLWLLGQRPAAWPWLYEGSRLALMSGDSRRLTVAYSLLHQAAQESSLLYAALAFSERLVELSTPELGQAGVAHALLIRARTRSALRRRESALQDLDAAANAAAAIADPDSRRQWLSDIWTEHGQLLLATAPAKAAAELRRATAVAQALHDSSRLIRFLTELSRAQVANHDHAAAATLSMALAEVERQRANLDEGESRADFLVRSRDVYDQWMTTALEAHEAPPALFEIADQARARTLRDALGLPAARASLARSLGSERALVEFAVLPHSLLSWVLSNGQIRFHVQNVEAEELEGWVHSLAINGSPDEVCEALRRLSAILIGPLDGEIAAPTLLISPDKSLRRVPFAALATAAGRPLIEDHAVVVVPSAALIDLTGATAGPAYESAFAVGDPRLDPQTFTFLPPLPGARKEATFIAGLYRPRSALCLGQDATAAALSRSFGRYAIVHLAAHMLANDQHPDLAMLPVARVAPDEPVALSAGDIRQLKAGRTRLVVLSSCRAAGSRDTEGSRGLVEAFLATGVPAVVAALGSVEDGSAQLFFERFHRRLKAGEEPAAALRNVQLELLHGQDPRLREVAVWGGYQLFQVGTTKKRRVTT
jgi:CHAT domain-containing protein